MDFLKKIICIIISFCMGCYTTAVYLDSVLVEKQKQKIIKSLEKILFNPDEIF